MTEATLSIGRPEVKSRPKLIRASAFAASVALTATGCAMPSANASLGQGPDVKIAYWNTFYETSAENTRLGINDILVQADILVLGEFSRNGKLDMLKKDVLDCSTCNHDAFISKTNHGSELTIVWDEDIWELEDPDNNTGSEFVEKELHFDDGGSGGNTINDKWITWAILKNKQSGKKIIAGNTHFLPSNNLPTRRPHLLHHIDALERFVEKMGNKGLPLFIGVDTNLDLRDPENKKLLNDIGVKILWDQLVFPAEGTFVGSKRVIDTLLSAYDEGVTPLAAVKFSTRYASDHYPVLGIYRLGEITADLESSDTQAKQGD